MDGMDISNMSNMSNMSRSGPSHVNDLSNQGFAPWHLGNQSGTDDVFMAAQEAVSAHRDSQGSGVEAAVYYCSCGRKYCQKATWYRHRRYECGKQPQLWCIFCSYCAKRKGTLDDHIKLKHLDQLTILQQAS